MRALRPMRALRGKMWGTGAHINQKTKLSRGQRCSEMTTAELLSDLQRQGFILIPLPEDKLAVKPAEKLTDALREAIRQRKVEVLALLAQRPRPYLTPD